MLRYYPPAAQHKLGSPWIGPHQVVRQATGHTVGIQRGADKPIIFVHVDDLKLCPGPQEIAWTPIVSTAKSLCASTVAFRPGSEIGEVTPDPSVDVSAWDDGSDLHHDSTIANDLDRLVDLTGHILSPFYQRELIYQDCKFQSIAHLLCYRYAIINDQKTFATGIRKWSRILVGFPIPKFKSNTETQQWLEILADIYTYLCTTDERIRSALVDTGPQFTPPVNRYTGSYTEDAEGDGIQMNAFGHDDADVSFDPLSANQHFPGTADMAVLGTLVFAGPTSND